MNRTAEEFKSYFRGVKTNDLVKAVSRLTPGINYSRCSKQWLADQWAYGSRGVSFLTLPGIEIEVRQVEKEMRR